MENDGFIGVHVGAGKYSSKLTPLYEKLCRLACKKAVEVLNSGKSSLEAVTMATAVLEDSPLTNAGYGSNLTLNGNVECDAIVMDGSTLSFGATGAVTGIKNPVMLAKKICCFQNEKMELGRIPPCILVGSGAYEFAQQYSDIITVHPESLKTRNSVKLYEKYKKQLKHFRNQRDNLQCNRLDTVGAVCIDNEGRTAAACSSGGILLKQPGRVGQAAVYGCGCWAQDKIQNEDANIAVTTSGCGEHIIKTLLARDVGTVMMKPSSMPCVTLNESFNNLFLDSPVLRNLDQKLCGMLVLRWNNDGGEFLWAHSTPAMCIGYMNSSSTKAKSRISELPNSAQPGHTVVVEGVSMLD